MPRVVKTRPIEALKEKFRKRVSAAGPDYEYGVKNPLRVWLEEFENAKEAIKAGMSAAAAEERFLMGAKRVGQRKWAENTARKGPGRWTAETPARADAWSSEFKHFADELSKLVLEPKGPKGDPANIDKRVKPVVEALVKKKKELRGLAK
jgi:hypothetical protein